MSCYSPEERHRTGGDGRGARGLPEGGATALVHPRRRFRVAARTRCLSAQARCQRRPLQRLLPVEGDRPLHQHQVLVPRVRYGPRRRRAEARHVVRERRLVGARKHLPGSEGGDGTLVDLG